MLDDRSRAERYLQLEQEAVNREMARRLAALERAMPRVVALETVVGTGEVGQAILNRLVALEARTNPGAGRVRIGYVPVGQTTTDVITVTVPLVPGYADVTVYWPTPFESDTGYKVAPFPYSGTATNRNAEPRSQTKGQCVVRASGSLLSGLLSGTVTMVVLGIAP